MNRDINTKHLLNVEVEKRKVLDSSTDEPSMPDHEGQDPRVFHCSKYVVMQCFLGVPYTFKKVSNLEPKNFSYGDFQEF